MTDRHAGARLGRAEIECLRCGAVLDRRNFERHRARGACMTAEQMRAARVPFREPDRRPEPRGAVTSGEQ